MAKNDNDNLVDSWLRYFKNHRVFAPIILFFIITGGIIAYVNNTLGVAKLINELFQEQRKDSPTPVATVPMPTPILITVDAKLNCGSKQMNEYEKRNSVKVDLPAGEYIAKLNGGAFSKWERDELMNNPWLSYVMIFIERDTEQIGQYIRSPDPKTAFMANAHAEIRFKIAKSTIVHFWIDDWSEEWGYRCSDNRGAVEVSIQKL